MPPRWPSPSISSSAHLPLSTPPRRRPAPPLPRPDELHDPCYWESTTNFHAGWSAALAAINAYLSGGVPASRLVLGLAAYGHGYTLLDPAVFLHPAPSAMLNGGPEGRRAGHCRPGREGDGTPLPAARWCTYLSVDTFLTVSSKVLCYCTGLKLRMHPLSPRPMQPSYGSLMDELARQGGSVYVDATERSAYYVRGTRWVGFDVAETLWMKKQVGAALWGCGRRDARAARLLPRHARRTFTSACS